MTFHTYYRSLIYKCFYDPSPKNFLSGLINGDHGTGDTTKLTERQIRLRRLNEEYRRFSKAAGLRIEPERAATAGFGRGEAARASGTATAYYNYWAKSRGVKNSIKNLAKYYDVKYTDSPRYELLRQYVRDVDAGWISPLVGFDGYESLYSRIQTEIVGHTVANGTTITGQRPHFMQRVVGTMLDPEKLKKDLTVIRRSGVEVESIKKALFSPVDIGDPVMRSNGKRSVRFIGEDCVVSINPDSGELIQTNPL